MFTAIHSRMPPPLVPPTIVFAILSIRFRNHSLYNRIRFAVDRENKFAVAYSVPGVGECNWRGVNSFEKISSVATGGDQTRLCVEELQLIEIRGF
jgi:hypothetical protein